MSRSRPIRTKRGELLRWCPTVWTDCTVCLHCWLSCQLPRVSDNSQHHTTDSTVGEPSIILPIYTSFRIHEMSQSPINHILTMSCRYFMARLHGVSNAQTDSCSPDSTECYTTTMIAIELYVPRYGTIHARMNQQFAARSKYWRSYSLVVQRLNLQKFLLGYLLLLPVYCCCLYSVAVRINPENLTFCLRTLRMVQGELLNLNFLLLLQSNEIAGAPLAIHNHWVGSHRWK